VDGIGDAASAIQYSDNVELFIDCAIPIIFHLRTDVLLYDNSKDKSAMNMIFRGLLYIPPSFS
jgi:hypothetical protein